MKRANLLLLAALCVAGTGSSAEERGRAVLHAALSALGGVEKLQRLANWHVRAAGRENLSADLQGFSPDAPTWRPHLEQVAVNAATMAVAWERKSPRNDESIRWRRLIMTPEGAGFFDWVTRHGRMGTTPAPEPRRRALARRVPHLLLLDAVSRTATVRWKEQRENGGRIDDAIDVTLPDSAELTLVISRTKPAVLRQVESRTYLPGAGDVPVVWEWREWRPHHGLVFAPAAHSIAVNGVPFQDVRYIEFSAPTESPALLRMPTAAEAAAPAATKPPEIAAPLPATGEVKPGVHIVDIGGFVVMFVEFRDFVVAVEAPAVHPGLEGIPAQPGSVRITSEFLSAIANAAPGKPVRYVVISHHHSDHLGGAGLFSAVGATLVVAPGHRAAAAKAAAAERSGDARIETVSDRRTISDGERTLDVVNIGSNPHTDENLFVWLPAEKILFQGDLFYYSTGGVFPPSGRDTINRFFARWLRAHDIRPVAVYGVHNAGAAGIELLDLSAQN